MMEVFKMLPEGTLAELINNQLYISPSPKSKHQIILNEINFHLLTYFKTLKTGMVYVSPFDVYLDQENVVQPDIVVILSLNRHILKEESYIHGVPDLLVEVLSEKNKDYDRITKKNLYQHFGVKEYWIVDSENKLATGYELRNGKYTLIAENMGLIKPNLLQSSFSF